MLFNVARKSLLDRKSAVLLAMLMVVISAALLLSVEQIREQTRASFNRNVSGVDMIVGARTSQLNLLLSSVFRIGDMTNGISWETYQHLKSQRQVKWTIPIALGDSHQGYAVVGTTTDYFNHYQYGNQQSLVFKHGEGFNHEYEVVIGTSVAQKLGYQLGDQIVLSHGTAKLSFSHHQEHPFTVVGILGKTHTPVDNGLHVQLSDIANIHGDKHHHQEQQIDSVSAVMVGLDSPVAVLMMQRFVNQYDKEALSAIIPGVALNQLWSLLSSFERVLLMISVLVLISALLGTAIMQLASIQQRRHEIRVLRILGASPRFIFVLIQLETLLVSMLGFGIAVVLLMSVSQGMGEWLNQQYGVLLELSLFNLSPLYLGGLIMLATGAAATIPAINAFRQAK